MHPSKQPKEHDGRPYPYNRWTSPLADMDTLYPERQERVQFGFEDASQSVSYTHLTLPTKA